MKTKKLASNRSRKSGDEEILKWATTHDVFARVDAQISEVVSDHSDLDQLLRDAMFEDNTTQLNMRLAPAMKAVLTQLARARTTDATTLARIWLAERLREELDRATKGRGRRKPKAA